MAASKLDGAGIEKMKTLEVALTQLQRVHGLVEMMGQAVKAQQSASIYGQQIRRAGSPMVGLLKGQFGMISDQVAAIMLVASRTGSDPVRLRSMREGVAQVRVQLELALAKVAQQHQVADGPTTDGH